MLPHLVLEDKIPYCDHFKWKEVLLCPQWGVHIYPTDEIAINLALVASKLDWIRKHFGRPIKITSAIRPLKYNRLIGGSKESMHIKGRALDFQVAGYTADRVRQMLLPFLDRLDIRMENKPYSDWVHIDTKKPRLKTNRFFYP